MNDATPQTGSGFWNTPGARSGLKLGALTVIVLIMLIPVAMIRSLVDEREQRRATTVEEVISLHGGRQLIAGPLLVIPVTTERISADGSRRLEREEVVVLPDDIRVEVVLEPELLERGIYEVPVFRTALRMRGSITLPSSGALRSSGTLPAHELESVEWADARLVVGLRDTTGLRSEPVVTVGGEPLAVSGESLAGAGLGGERLGGAFGVRVQAVAGSTREFTVDLELSGGGSLHLVPAARNASVSISSPWPTPSFSGDVLPTRRALSDEGFTASWETTSLGLGLPNLWLAGASGRPEILSARIGVDLYEPVDHYQRTMRSVKYAALFVILPFAALFLLETFAAIRIHPIQYLLVAAAKVIFYLLLLSLSEHLRFGVAYWTAAGATMTVIASYVAAIAPRVRQSAPFAAMIAAEYVLLFAALQSEAYALLIGSVGLFAIVSALMLATAAGLREETN